MQLHELNPKHKLKKSKRIGRGGKRGTYSGRGQKGQKSRAGRRLKPAIRELIKKYPKLRGSRQKSRIRRIAILNLEILEGKFGAGERVNPKTLVEKGILGRIRGRIPEVKILGKGEIKKALFFEGCSVSEQAKAQINKAGGTIK